MLTSICIFEKKTIKLRIFVIYVLIIFHVSIIRSHFGSILQFLCTRITLLNHAITHTTVDTSGHLVCTFNAIVLFGPNFCAILPRVGSGAV